MLGRFFAALSGRKPAAPIVPSMTVIEPLRAEDIAFLAERRGHAVRIVADAGDPVPGWQPTLGNVQALYEDGLDHGIADEPYYEAVAVLFGDELVRRYGLEWVHARDDYGVTLAVSVKGKQIYAAPIDMILKRFEREERIDFASLVEETHRTLAEVIAEGEVGDR